MGHISRVPAVDPIAFALDRMVRALLAKALGREMVDGRAAQTAVAVIAAELLAVGGEL